jgi:hypothetical protein
MVQWLVGREIILRLDEEGELVMREALLTVGLMIVAGIIGSLLKPTPDQLRPLTPQPSSGDAGHDHHH